MSVVVSVNMRGDGLGVMCESECCLDVCEREREGERMRVSVMMRVSVGEYECHVIVMTS